MLQFSDENVSWIELLPSFFFFFAFVGAPVNFTAGGNYSPNPRRKASEAIPAVNPTSRYPYKIALSSPESRARGYFGAVTAHDIILS